MSDRRHQRRTPPRAHSLALPRLARLLRARSARPCEFRDSVIVRVLGHRGPHQHRRLEVSPHLLLPDGDRPEKRHTSGDHPCAANRAFPRREGSRQRARSRLAPPQSPGPSQPLELPPIRPHVPRYLRSRATFRRANRRSSLPLRGFVRRQLIQSQPPLPRLVDLPPPQRPLPPPQLPPRPPRHPPFPLRLPLPAGRIAPVPAARPHRRSTRRRTEFAVGPEGTDRNDATGPSSETPPYVPKGQPAPLAQACSGAPRLQSHA